VVTFAAGPARDFYLAASDRYARMSATVGETTVNSYAPPEYSGSSAYALQVAVSALKGFNARFGAYPYAELDVLAVPMSAGGIEYPGAVGIALMLYDENAEVSGLPSRVVLESATAHEVAHQWFYNVVGNDQVDDPWLDEAVVQYATYLYYVDAYGSSAARGFRDSWVGRWDRVDQAEIPIGLPAREYDSAEYGAIVYGRGPLFVEALAREMGADAFEPFIRDYYQSHLWAIGTPESFQSLAEQHCNCDLDGLFQEWVY
jgi:aminopeptidase N